MRLQKYLQEEYLTRMKKYNESVEIFVNPSFKEMREASTTSYGICFIADSKTKKVYVWDSENTIYHQEVCRELNLGSLKIGALSMRLLAGYADQNGNKFEMGSVDGDGYVDDAIVDNGLDKILNNFKWVDKYINITKYLNDHVQYKI